MKKEHYEAPKLETIEILTEHPMIADSGSFNAGGEDILVDKESETNE